MGEVGNKADPVVRGARLEGFTQRARAASGAALASWLELHRWSTEQYRDFWRLWLEDLSPLYEGDPSVACTHEDVERARFFPDVRLNYAENLLRERPGDGRVVLSALDESGLRSEHTRAELRRHVLAAARGLESLGVGRTSRTCALARNDAATVIACLASAALGASWSSVSPDLGAESVLSRFRPIAPEVLFAHTSLHYQGQTRPLSELITQVLAEVPSLRAVVLLDEGAFTPPPGLSVGRLSTLLETPPRAGFERVPFDHPLFVLFSSGTTGAPKCIVHGHGGTLLEHLKELLLHTDLQADDALCFVTSTGWMMWNWLLSALGTEARVVLHDGSVSYPEQDSLLQRLAAQGVSVFGTSPAYLRYLEEAEILPRERCSWPALRAILSTGSILYEDQYDFVARAFGELPLQSISGGTDILGCFVLGHPRLPVPRGESQCVSLGLDVRAHDGREHARIGVGELTCVRPFPSRPVGLFDDADGQRFHEAYFSQHAGAWTHGDLIALSELGSARILGRSDGVLNIRGIRIGPAEIYRVVASIPEVLESMAVDQAAPALPGGKKLVLLVVLRDGLVLDRPLTFRIKRTLKERAGATHVPDLIVQVSALPQTHNGKRSERAVQDLLNGRRPRNLEAIKNPEALRALFEISELQLPAGLLDR